ncbi:MAG: cytochrome C oxidase subunit IV family protein [Thermoanaerobaculia bacterium]
MAETTHEHGHVVPLRIYFAIFGTLMVLTAATVFVAFRDLGPWNTIVAMGIAVTKATLVILYFMHVRYSDRLTRIVVAAGLFWFAILIALTLSDFWTRPWLGVPGR